MQTVCVQHPLHVDNPVCVCVCTTLINTSMQTPAKLKYM